MISNITRIECKVGEKVYHLSCDMDSPVADVKEAVFQFQKYIGHIEDQIKKNLEAQKAAEAEKAAVVEESPKQE
jgi:hypothetical protein